MYSIYAFGTWCSTGTCSLTETVQRFNGPIRCPAFEKFAVRGLKFLYRSQRNSGKVSQKEYETLCRLRKKQLAVMRGE